ncbi:MAG: DUF91 domain-containing protein [Phycisphaerales bacterium]|nr:MAG: DUF91 domain-containing protein [Phycisphaerales bacterium]
MKKAKGPPVWSKVREAIKTLGGSSTNVDVRNWILKQYRGTNKNSIQAEIIVCTVNHPSRIHYPQNRKPRRSTGRLDFLFRPEAGKGKLELYDPSLHGDWEIAQREDGSLVVQRFDESAEQPRDEDMHHGDAFAAEHHLRDYLVQHLEQIEKGLELYVDDEGRTGVEYPIKVGRIDILARAQDGAIVVIELKVAKGSDSACGQVLGYMGWIKRHIADGKAVRGIVVAQRITDRIRYALADSKGVTLKEYELSLKIRDAEPLQ